MNNKIFGTPEPTLSVELRSILDKENILTKKTKRKVLDALDEHIVNDEDRKKALRRKNIVQEIYSSEESYLLQLEKLIKFFKKPIEKNQMAPASVLNALFGNVESIYDVNKEFFSRLKESKEKIVSTFLTTAPFFKVYSAYAYGYKHIISMLESMPKSNPSLHQFISNQETRPEVGIKISSLLISPIQRIPRYLLLLKELKLLTPESTFAYTELEDAIQEMSNIVEHIESLMQEQENTYRMIEIQRSLLNGKPSIIAPGRKLIKEGRLNKVINDSASPRYIVLLNDMILYCKNWTSASLKCLRVLPIVKCAINAIGFQKGVFSLQCQSFSVVLCSLENPNVTHEWVESIQNAIDQCKKNKRSLRKLSSHRRPLERKDFNQIEDDSNILNRKRSNLSADDDNTVCLGSPWKKMKTCTSAERPKDENTMIENDENQLKDKHSNPSYVKMAKQFITSVKQSTQKFMNDVDPANCQSIPNKISAITNQ